MKNKFICLAIDFYKMGKDVVDEVYFNEDPGSWNSYEDLFEIKSPDYQYSKTDARKNPSEVLVRIGDKKDKKKLENGWESALTSAYQKFIKYLYERRLPKTEFYVEGQMMYVSMWMRTYFKLKYGIQSVEVGTGVYGDLETDKRLLEEDVELSLTENVKN